MFKDSIIDRVLELTGVPVEVVAGGEVSRLARFGIPAGVGAVLTLLAVSAID